MRALLYHRTSSADLAEPASEALEQLRRYAALRGWRVVAEHVDHHSRHDAPRPEREALAAAIAAGRADVIIVNGFSRLFRGPRDFALAAHAWLQQGVALVALGEGIDGTTTAGKVLLADAARLLHRLDHEVHSEATRVGVLLSRIRSGDGEPAAWGRARSIVVINRLEVKALYEDGKGGRYLSLRQIVAEIKRSGGRMSAGTLTKVLRTLREAGQLDEAKRAALRERSGAKPAGRPPRRVSYDPEEIRALRARGYGVARIRRLATSLPKHTSTWQVRKIFRELDAADRARLSSRPPGTPALEKPEPKAG